MNAFCPCCRTNSTLNDSAIFHCTTCFHAWSPSPLPDDYYATCPDRNVGVYKLERKYTDRITGISHLLRSGMRILEIGCADGEFGAKIKELIDVHYVGLEISPDASLAEKRLDQVHRMQACDLETAPFDLLLSFHVLEHLPHIQMEVTHWRRLLKTDGRLIVEVPNRAGHPLISQDQHPEHIHQFSPTSLTILLEKADFAPIHMSTGHFESIVYSDGLRIEAQGSLNPEQKIKQLLTRFTTHLSGQFVVFGVGGDFHNYVEFILPQLPVAALCDSNPKQWGTIIGNHKIVAYDPITLSGLPILIASTRHEDEIRYSLLAHGVPENSIISLIQIYG